MLSRSKVGARALLAWFNRSLLVPPALLENILKSEIFGYGGACSGARPAGDLDLGLDMGDRILLKKFCL